MKKVLFFVLSFMFILCTTGCVKYSYNIEIDDKDNINVSEINAINISMIKSFNPSASKQIKEEFEKSKQELENEGYKVEHYSDETFSGLKRLKEYQISAYHSENLPEGFSAIGNEPIVLDKGFFKNTYTMSLKFNSKQLSQNNKSFNTGLGGGDSFGADNYDSAYMNGERDRVVSRKRSTDSLTGTTTERMTYENGDVITRTYNQKDADEFDNAMNKMAESIPGISPVIDLTVKIPKKAKEHNADKVISENEYQWNLATNEPVEITIVYEKTNWLNIILTVFFIFILIFGIISFRKNTEFKRLVNR